MPKRRLSPRQRAGIDAANERKRIEREGWPRPTEVNAYDANLKLGPPIRIVGRPDSQRPMPRVSSPYVEVHSLTGNSSEMVAL